MPQQEFADFTIEQDFTDVPEMTGEFSLVPPGDYVVDVINLEQKSSKKNNPMVVVTYQVAEADAQINDAARGVAGQRIWGNYSLLPQSIGRLKTLMVACQASLARFQASEILNSRILVTVIHNKGEAQQDANGNDLPERYFANVVNERAVEMPEAAPQKMAAPPITRGKPAPTPNGQKAGAARRA